MAAAAMAEPALVVTSTMSVSGCCSISTILSRSAAVTVSPSWADALWATSAASESLVNTLIWLVT